MIRFFRSRWLIKEVILTIFLISFSLTGKSQSLSQMYELDAEFGVTGGVAHYLGDLNTRMKLNNPKVALGVFFKKQLNAYAGIKLSGHYARLGYSDMYNKNDFEHKRNLSFNTNIFELALQGEFNFFRFIPADPDHVFTPYISAGVGIFSYNPYAYLEGDKHYLRPLHTEGQTFYDGRKTYGSMALSFPIGFGIKYAVTDNINILAEVGYRFTTTDYIDDVSTTYVGIDKFGDPTHNIAAQLQDRSYEIGTPIGIEGRQRGFSEQKDHYMFAEVGISINLMNYKCPVVK